MSPTRWRARLLASTRGRVLALVRRSDTTVTDLAAELGLTDNAVRSHLAALERDGLIEQRGVRRQVGKPAHVFGITTEGEALFPKAYALVLSELVRALQHDLGDESAERLLREVGRRLAAPRKAPARAKAKQRIDAAVGVLEELSGPVEVEPAGAGASLLRGSGCPLGAVVTDRPEMCRLVEALLAEVTGARVTECCARDAVPRCCFRIANR